MRKLKKFTSVLLSGVLALGALTAVPMTAGAVETTQEVVQDDETYTSGDYEYSLLDDGTAEITDYTGSDTELEIPSTLDGYTVTGIGDGAFYEYDCLTSIIIPDSVTSIGYCAFMYCSNLTNITIPDSVTRIEINTFYGCTNLASITIPDSVESVGEYVFEETAWYENQPDGIVYVGKVAYKYKGVMPENTSINLKDGTKGIADFAFYYCDNLTSITIPDSVTNIGENAFGGCEDLTSITIPDSVTSIGSFAFSDCSSLTSITIPDSVTSVGDDAFFGCDSLVDVTIGNSVTSIGDGAFKYCDSLTSITIPDSVTSIGSFAFSDCSSLTSIKIPDNVTSIGDYAFGYYYDSYYNPTKVENFTIYGYTGTAAETYANENGFTFISLGEATEPTTTEPTTTKPTTTEPATEPAETYILGDVNEDGVVDISDATAIQKAVAKITTLSESQQKAAEVNGDGTIDITDATMIQKYVAKIITEFSAAK